MQSFNIEFRGDQMIIKNVPLGMSIIEALTFLQPLIDQANKETGEDIKIILPEEV